MTVLYVLGYFNRNKQNSYAALTNVIYFIISCILNDTVHISGTFYVSFKPCCLIVINYFILTDLFFCGIVINRILPLKTHTPASRQPGASYAQRSP